MTHRDAPPESESQRQCREWWTAREPHVTRNWSRTKWGTFHPEATEALHQAWLAAQAAARPE